MSFEALGIEESLLQSIQALGFVDPTPIQEKAIPILLENKTDMHPSNRRVERIPSRPPPAAVITNA